MDPQQENIAYKIQQLKSSTCLQSIFVFKLLLFLKGITFLSISEVQYSLTNDLLLVFLLIWKDYTKPSLNYCTNIGLHL